MRFASSVVLLAAAACNLSALDVGTPGASTEGGTAGPIFIQSVLAPTTPDAGTCTYSADPTSPFLSTGIVDVAFTSLESYRPTLLVGNENPSGTVETASQAINARVTIQGGTTRITDLQGNGLLTMLEVMFESGDRAAQATGEALESGALTMPESPFTSVETATLNAPSDGTVSYGVTVVTLVDSDTLAVLRYYFQEVVKLYGVGAALGTTLQLLTYTSVDGVTGAGANEQVESNTYLFAVTFGYGILVSNLAATSSMGPCVTQSTTASPMTCAGGQDISSYLSSTDDFPACPSMTGDAGADAHLDASVPPADSSTGPG